MAAHNYRAAGSSLGRTGKYDILSEAIRQELWRIRPNLSRPFGKFKPVPPFEQEPL